MLPNDFGGKLASWANQQTSITGLVLIGSRERAESDAIWRADAESDWDFHVITSNPKLFLDSTWTTGLAEINIRAYAARMTRIGNVPKINAVFSETEADLVIIPSQIIRKHWLLTKLKWHRLKLGDSLQFLQDLAVVVRPGFRFLKDTRNWKSFYQFATIAVSDARLSDDAAIKVANGFVCDYVWTVRKISRGEYFAAQRMLHRELMDANFRLLHELKLRRGERTFPEARRIERVAAPEELALLSVTSNRDELGLTLAVEKCAQACRELMKALVGKNWIWPNLNR